MSDDRHEHFLRKNASLSRAFELDKKEKYEDKAAKGEVKKVVQICSKCKKEKPTLKYRVNQTDRGDGSASFSVDMVPLCDDCKPKETKKFLAPKEINSMLRNAKKGRI